MDQVAAAQFANFMARFYQNMAAQVGDTLHQSIGVIPDSQASILADDQMRLLSYSNTFFSLSDAIAFQGADEYFQSARDATGQIADALKHIDKIDKVISITANVIGLGGGIVSKNTSMMETALMALKDQIKL